MKQHSRSMAICGLSAALALVIMVLGSTLAVLTYACPLLVGILLLCIREELGTRTCLTLWAAIGLLALLLVPEPEMTAMFLGVFGWYPAAKPALERLPRPLALCGKLVSLNAGTFLVYTALFFIMGLEDLPDSLWGWLLLLVMFNVVFLSYDYMLSQMRVYLVPRLRRLFPRP